jgi:lipoprotein-anchoring transpeptidase ErfK/SrfK
LHPLTIPPKGVLDAALLGSFAMVKFVAGLMACAMAFVLLIDTADAKKRKRYRKAPPAAVQIHVDISTQSMSVNVNGSHYASWRVSTGRRGFETPTGSYSVKRMARMHYSKKYDNAPMPHAMFYTGGIAIHGTNSVHKLGRPASHGCVRLAQGNAAQLFNLVQRYGRRARVNVSY